jgi:hypothetical protein
MFVQVEEEELVAIIRDPARAEDLFLDYAASTPVLSGATTAAERRIGSPDRASVGVTMSIEKAWHGVHFLLCGELEPGDSPLSQAVLGGMELEDDPNGALEYGPARFFTGIRVAEIAEELQAAEPRARRRFDPWEMSRMRVYPSSGEVRWNESDLEWVMDGFHQLRDFYRDAARNRRAVVTCLV